MSVLLEERCEKVWGVSRLQTQLGQVSKGGRELVNIFRTTLILPKYQCTLFPPCTCLKCCPRCSPNMVPSSAPNLPQDLWKLSQFIGPAPDNLIRNCHVLQPGSTPGWLGWLGLSHLTAETHYGWCILDIHSWSNSFHCWNFIESRPE